MNIETATINHTNIMSMINALSWRQAYKGIVPQEFLDSLKDDFWVSAFGKWMHEMSIEAKIIYDGNKAVGCVSYGKSREANLQDWGEIISLYLLPEYFGKGYGKLLMESAIKELENLGYENIFLWVLKENYNAKSFYHKCGFKESSDIDYIELSGKKLAEVRYTYITK